MKGQYFSFDALMGAIIFITIIVVAVGMFFSSSFTQKVYEEELRLHALKIGNMLLSPYGYASFYTPNGPKVVNSAVFNTIARKVNDISPYRVELRLLPLQGCSFYYPVGIGGKSASLYRITTLDVECGGRTYRNVPALLSITVYG